jgi:hypothetical protein
VAYRHRTAYESRIAEARREGVPGFYSKLYSSLGGNRRSL